MSSDSPTRLVHEQPTSSTRSTPHCPPNSNNILNLPRNSTPPPHPIRTPKISEETWEDRYRGLRPIKEKATQEQVHRHSILLVPGVKDLGRITVNPDHSSLVNRWDIHLDLPKHPAQELLHSLRFLRSILPLVTAFSVRILVSCLLSPPTEDLPPSFLTARASHQLQLLITSALLYLLLDLRVSYKIMVLLLDSRITGKLVLSPGLRSNIVHSRALDHRRPMINQVSGHPEEHRLVGQMMFLVEMAHLMARQGRRVLKVLNLDHHRSVKGKHLRAVPSDQLVRALHHKV